MRRVYLLAAAMLLAVACSRPTKSSSPRPSGAADANSDPSPGQGDAADASTDPSPDQTDATDTDTDPTPSVPLSPLPGELYYMQLGLSGLALGEAAIIVGPDGKIVLVDVGNDSHADDLHAAIDATIDAMNAAGFVPRQHGVIDDIILTHHHADHTNGLAQLLELVQVSGRVIHRGYYDVGAVDASTFESSCAALAARPSLELALCSGAARAPCATGSWQGTYPVTSCSPEVADALLSFGAEAGIHIFALNGIIDGQPYGTLPTDTHGENARSMVALVRRGDFRLLLGGDLTGGGSSTPPVEGFFAPYLGSAAGIDILGVDVLHAGHHGRKTSSSQPWIDALLPRDGRSRNAIMGVSEGHVNSPHDEVLEILLSASRLREGFAWTTLVALFGSRSAGLIDAEGGSVVLRTHLAGKMYDIQAVSRGGAVITAQRYPSVHAGQ